MLSHDFPLYTVYFADAAYYGSHVDEFEIAYPDYDDRRAETANGIAFISGALTPTSEVFRDVVDGDRIADEFPVQVGTRFFEYTISTLTRMKSWILHRSTVSFRASNVHVRAEL